ncbi:hypothetical protein ACMYSQ_012434 [Aspergillus niger]
MAYREPIQGQLWYNWRQRKLTELMGLQERDDSSSLYSDNSENCILPEYTVVDTNQSQSRSQQANLMHFQLLLSSTLLFFQNILRAMSKAMHM